MKYITKVPCCELCGHHTNDWQWSRTVIFGIEIILEICYRCDSKLSQRANDSLWLWRIHNGNYSTFKRVCMKLFRHAGELDDLFKLIRETRP